MKRTSMVLLAFAMVAGNANQDLDMRKQMLASAIVGLTHGSILRFRWDDTGTTPDRITHMLLRQ